MPWLKNVVIDLLVTLLIVAAVVLEWAWAVPVLWVYTALMLVLKGAALFAGSLTRLAASDNPPPRWFLHLLYAVNVAVLAVGAMWFLAGGWALIWILSAVAERRANR